MADRASPLAALPATLADGAVTLRQVDSGSILQVCAWPDTPRTVETVMKELLGLDPPASGGALGDEHLRVVATGPGRFLVASAEPDLPARFEAALPTGDAAVTDLSHGRLLLRLEGDDVAALLAKVVALDLAAEAFPPGRAAQTAIHHMDVVLDRVAPAAFNVWAFRSFAQSLAEWLLDAGAELGAGFHR